MDFSPQGLVLRALNARLLGGDTTLDGNIGADGTLRLSAQGTATAEALRSAAQPAALARIGGLLRGQAAWRGTLAVADGRRDLPLQSNLVGMQIDLPAPLAKPLAATSLPLRLQLSPTGRADAATKARDSLQFELGDLLRRVPARPVRARAAGATRQHRGAGHAAAAAGRGRAGGAEPGPRGPRCLAGTGRTQRRAAAEPTAGGYLPQTLQLRADELRSGTRLLSNVQATLSSQGPASEPWWKASLKADQLAGDIEYRPPSGNAQAGRVTARLQRLSVPQSEVSSVEGLLSQPPASVPALDIVVDDFELRGRKLGRLQVLAVNRLLPGRAGQREWQLDKLDLDAPEAQFAASGRWAAGGSRRMALDFKLALADSGAFLERLGAGQALRGGKGEMQGQLSWAGSPLTLDYPSLEGQLRLDVDAGQFLHADPGSARLLGVLSLQSLPRRLSLDFRDLFQEGFAFDSIEGDVKVARGVAADLRHAHARRAGHGADARQCRPAARNAGPARADRAQLRRHRRRAGDDGHQPGHRPGHLVCTMDAARAADRRRHAASCISPARWADPQVQRVDRKADDAGFGAGQRRRQHPATRGPQDEDRRAADGVHPRRGAQPRRRRGG